VLEVGSDCVMQLIPEVVINLIKIIKTTNLEAGLRALALESLRRMFTRLERITDENIAKELVKIARHSLADKFNVVQLRALEVFSNRFSRSDQI